MTSPIYAIGDIHGYLDKLEEVMDQIVADGGPDAEVVFLGDLVDRGPDSKGVIDFVLNGLKQGRNWTVLNGNHDRMFRYFMEPSPRVDMRLRPDLYWLHERLGGRETLASYGLHFGAEARLSEIHAAARATVPAEHVAFLTKLPYTEQSKGLLFVHAGIVPEVPLADQSNDDLCWIRDDFLSYLQPHPWLVVHGHTPVEHASHHGNRVNLDTGAGYGRPVSAAVFEDGRVWSLQPEGRQELLPNP
ncbi:metallophosphoesterase [Shimia sagamensis]|uniref:Serine/threonine protein phosphatase 1 n=1 Tax=Shimia sagamensis TaxID=1566352 RepID=A0ABY1NDM4_9RHOB|nr:metallophosphoesterase [Shimia sagamensis]SMP06909.1 serine/threonine protein phosphatase 1 [Shimia sagamensis]